MSNTDGHVLERLRGTNAVQAIPPKSGIYKIRHTPSGMAYVGHSQNIKTRCCSHLSELRRGKHIIRQLQEVFDADGEQSLDFEVVELVSGHKELYDREYHVLMSIPERLRLNKDWRHYCNPGLESYDPQAELRNRLIEELAVEADSEGVYRVLGMGDVEPISKWLRSRKDT